MNLNLNRILEQLNKSKIRFQLLLILSVILFSLVFILPIDSPFSSISLFFAIVLSCLSASLFVLSRAEDSPAVSWKFLIVAGVLIRFTVAVQPYATIDMSTWAVVAETVVDGGDIYATGRVSWTAIWPLTLGALMHLSNLTGIYFYIFVRILLLLNDLILLFIIKAVTEKLNYTYLDSLKAQLLYFLNPLTVIITIYHPQFGSIAFTALLGSYYLTISSSNQPNLLSSLLLALGTAVKQITLPALIAFTLYARSWKEMALLPLLTLFIFLFLLSPYYIYDPNLIETTVFGYMSRSGYFGFWGSVYEYFPGIFAELMQYKRVFVLAAFTTSALLAARAKSLGRSLPEAIQISLMGFLLLTPGWAIQYLYWLLPFGSIVKLGRKQMFLYSVFGSLAYLEYFYGDWYVNPQLFLPFVYLTIFWWLREIFKTEAGN